MSTPEGAPQDRTGAPLGRTGTPEAATLPRAEDVFRHLEDLRTGTFEGAREWPERVEVFERAVALLDPVVREALAQTDEVFLARTGTITHHVGEEEGGGRVARWELSWPAQRRATARHGGGVPPIQVIVVFGRGNTHPHWSGTTAGMWPCQVTSREDARRQATIVRAIVEAELHQRILEGRWQVVPGFAGRHKVAPP